MKNLDKTKIEYIQEFLLSKGYVWKGLLKDHLKMINRHAEIEDFRNKKMVRLIVSIPNNDKYFIQRVIVSDALFRIENLNLNQMDNFESFNEEWIKFLNSKLAEEEAKLTQTENIQTTNEV